MVLKLKGQCFEWVWEGTNQALCRCRSAVKHAREFCFPQSKQEAVVQTLCCSLEVGSAWVLLACAGHRLGLGFPFLFQGETCFGSSQPRQASQGS